MKEYVGIASEFASALVSSEYDQASALTTDHFKEQCSVSELRSEYEEMTLYGDSSAINIEVMETLEEWPAKKAGDFGWVYIAISGEDFSEAVAVTVCCEKGKALIREIEWGRP